MNKILGLLAALVMSVSLSGTAVAAPEKAEPITYCANTPETPLTGTYKKVVVSEYASCYIQDATIKSLQANNTPTNVVVVDTTVTHNFMVNGATGNVVLGARGCGYDPEVGRNVVVRNSHNVLVCYVTAGNNITVRGNDGRITVRDNVAGNNIKVSRNKAFVADRPVRPAASRIRLLRNTADNHIQVYYNHATRHIVLRGNTPDPDVKLLD